ncbi:conserved hypothetical protein [Trichinella spiralis]|uniref:hypothetical protein n=1 Tax=Trichinella spiralis TaxID=6334 RepID=UPI0001EFE96F|nr:conserved hypothetical protein [Trichinella spiralis]
MWVLIHQYVGSRFSSSKIVVRTVMQLLRTRELLFLSGFSQIAHAVCSGIFTNADGGLIDLSEGIYGVNSAFRNKLPLSSILLLKLTRVIVDVEEVISHNRKQGHCSHPPHYAFDK